MIYLESTHKRLSIPTFLSKINKHSMRNVSNKYHFLGDVHYEKYHNYHQTKNYQCLLVADFINNGNIE